MKNNIENLEQNHSSRRQFMAQMGLLTAASFLPETIFASAKPHFEISLAEFSLAGSLFSGKLKNMDFPAKAKNDFGINAVEYVSMFWADKAKDQAYLNELKQRTADLGVRNVLIMVDSEGDLGASDASARQKAIENHYKWVDAAKFLGCHSIRVNMDGDGTPEEIMKAGVDGYGKLVEYGQKAGIGVIIENHITISTNPDWLVSLLKQVNNPFAGCLPDFGNFIQREKPKAMTMEGFRDAKVIHEYDKYDGVKKLMPFAKGVSAKTHLFDDNGNCTDTDFAKMMPIVNKGLSKNFKGFVGIEYEGGFMKMMGAKENYLDEDAGIRATKALLEKYRM
ncbi:MULTISPECIES: TIM barrel protein [unclassified Arcicella]|uniref:sugar phosphate isomerase/epimerase family protein n=1 Tax=unclassified Arcicella TaxID=2644986 RepID=UPI002862007F|nr:MULTISPECIES: TIM barrel protein [unclassified Arcicella]MDR6564832.1 sugar phosphate isomerase/epimerase [Arcicella sp. BE51]MDR6826051.1 sugar phosphate isomerase/epimerase [Arcicella sp. BE139]